MGPEKDPVPPAWWSQGRAVPSARVEKGVYRTTEARGQALYTSRKWEEVWHSGEMGMGTLEDTRRNIQTGGMRCRLTASHKGALGGAGAFLTVARGAAGSHGGGGYAQGNVGVISLSRKSRGMA